VNPEAGGMPLSPTLALRDMGYTDWHVEGIKSSLAGDRGFDDVGELVDGGGADSACTEIPSSKAICNGRGSNLSERRAGEVAASYFHAAWPN
jgi:hypothetical protein